MKGERALDGIPFRWGGISHNYEMTNEDWQKESWVPYSGKPMRCYACGGIMKNLRSRSGTLLQQHYPYCGVFKITRGKNKGKFMFHILCRSCAYMYGRGVIEMDAETYKSPLEFDERKYKEAIAHEQAVDAVQQRD